jgi:hypothetical protein
MLYDHRVPRVLVNFAGYSFASTLFMPIPGQGTGEYAVVVLPRSGVTSGSHCERDSNETYHLVLTRFFFFKFPFFTFISFFGTRRNCC